MWKWKSGRKVEFQIGLESNSREINKTNRYVKGDFFSLTKESNEYIVSLEEGSRKVYMK